MRGSLPAGSRARLPLSPFALATLLTLPACHFASSPLDGFGGFIGDTHTFTANPNMPPGAEENIRRAQGRDIAVDPLLPEPGNIWPGPAPIDPTLSDVLREQNQQSFDRGPAQNAPGNPPANPGEAPHRQPRGSSTPPGSAQPPPPVTAAPPETAPPPSSTIPPPPPVVQSPSGPLIPSGRNTVTAPGGATSIVVPNGNGTSTVINPDGTTQTVPTPR